MELKTLKRILLQAANVTRDFLFIVATLDDAVFINVEWISGSVAREVVVALSAAHSSRIHTRYRLHHRQNR